MKAEEKQLQGKEDYRTPQTFLCEHCCSAVLISQPATLLLYKYEGPKFPKNIGDVGPSLQFVKVCRPCGDYIDD